MNQSKKGFVSFDLLFAALPLLLMLSHMFTIVWMATETGENSLLYKEKMGKLTSIADYLVKRGAVERSLQGTEFLGTATYSPNAIDKEELDRIDVEGIRNWMELESLEISLDAPAGSGTCIYRIVLLDDEVKKLYVCGD